MHRRSFFRSLLGVSALSTARATDLSAMVSQVIKRGKPRITPSWLAGCSGEREYRIPFKKTFGGQYDPAERNA